MRTPPCKDCPQRTAECHAACVSYARWRAQNTRQPPPDAEYASYIMDKYTPRYRAKSRLKKIYME